MFLEQATRIGRVGKKETKDGGAVPRYNNRAPQPRLADDFIELVSILALGRRTSLKPPEIITPACGQVRF